MIDMIPSRDDRRERSSSRRFIVLTCLLLLTALLGTGCASRSEARRPTVYRGGQYYGDAEHAQNLASQ